MLHFVREMNDPVMVIQATVVTSCCACLNSFYTNFRSYLFKLIYICGHFLTVKNRRYGRWYARKKNNTIINLISLNFTLI